MGTSGTNPLVREELPAFTLDEPLDEVPSDASDARRAAANANALLGTSFEEGSEGRYVYLEGVPRSLRDRAGSEGDDASSSVSEGPTVLAIESLDQLPDDVSVDAERTRAAADG